MTDDRMARAREEVARIIDPDAWAWADGLIADANSRTREEISERLRSKATFRMAPSLTKADAILALMEGGERR